MLTVTIEPVGRPAFAPRVVGQVTYSTDLVGGYAQASVEAALSEAERDRCVYATMKIHGTDGIVWQGIVTNKPTRGEPLMALGWGVVLTFIRQPELFVTSDVTRWKPRTHITAKDDWNLSVEEDLLLIGQPHRNTTATEAHGFVFDFGRTVPRSKVQGHLHHTWTTVGDLVVYSGVFDGVYTYSEPITWTSRGTYDTDNGDWSATCTTDHRYWLLNWQVGTGTPTSAMYARFENVKVFAESDASNNLITAPTSSTVIKALLARLPSWAYGAAAYQGFIATETTELSELTAERGDTLLVPIQTLLSHIDYCYGWYIERVSGVQVPVAHWESTSSSSPSYVIDAADCTSTNIQRSSLETMADSVIATYSTPDGTPAAVTATDSDASHYLKVIGRPKAETVWVGTHSSTDATSAANLALGLMGREQFKGTVTTGVVRTAKGAPVPLSTVRPGRWVTVTGLPDGAATSRIVHVECVGSSSATLTLDSTPHALAGALSRLERGIRM